MTPTSINDISKHIIIVFESYKGEESNDYVYNEFKNMLNGVIASVKSLNPGQRNPKVNLIGHSRGGLTNLQYALDYPENVDSMVSVGTPYFKSPAANALGELILGSSAGLDDINNKNIFNGYYSRWEAQYESKYKYINSIAIGSITTIDFLRNTLEIHGDAVGNMLSFLLSFYQTSFGQIAIIGLEAIAASAYLAACATIFTFPTMFTPEQVFDIFGILNTEIGFNFIKPSDTAYWFSDVLVPLGAQQGVDGDKNYRFTKHVKCFSGASSSTIKRNVNELPVIHNLETRNSEIINYICNNIVIRSGDVPSHFSTDISNIGKAGNRWMIRVRNTYGVRRQYAYNTKMCFEGDAKSWTGLTDVATFWLEPGEVRDLEIEEHGTATHIAISSISGNIRYIRYANELSNDFNYFKMTTGSTSKFISTYDKAGINIAIVGKFTNKWTFKITNNTGKSRDFDYNTKMCYEDDAKKWVGLTDIAHVYIENGASCEIDIYENWSATHIAISYIDDSYKRIIYVNELTPDGNMNVQTSTIPYDGSIQILDKIDNKWKIKITNTFGERREIHYNKKMCYEHDAKNWSGLLDVESFWLNAG